MVSVVGEIVASSIFFCSLGLINFCFFYENCQNMIMFKNHVLYTILVLPCYLLTLLYVILFYLLFCTVSSLLFVPYLLDPCNVNMSLSPTHLDYFLGGKIIIIYISGKYTTRKIHKNYIWDSSGLFSIISLVNLSMI